MVGGNHGLLAAQFLPLRLCFRSNYPQRFMFQSPTHRFMAPLNSMLVQGVKIRLYTTAIVFALVGCSHRMNEKEFAEYNCHSGSVSEVEIINNNLVDKVSDRRVKIIVSPGITYLVTFRNKTDSWYSEHGVVPHGFVRYP